MSVYEMFVMLLEKCGPCLCVNTETGAYWASPLDLPVDFASLPEYYAHFEGL